MAAHMAARYASRRWVGTFGALFAAYLTLGSLIVTFVSYVDHPIWLAVTTMLAASGCLLLPGLPTVGAGLVTALWSLAPIVSAAGSDTLMPPHLEYAALFAAGVAAHFGVRRYLPLLAAAFGVYLCGMFGVIGAGTAGSVSGGMIGSSGDLFGVLNTVAETAIRFALATVAGVALREQQRKQTAEAALERSRMTLERHRSQQTLATRIHDGIANKLAFLLMTLDRHIDGDTVIDGEELRRMRDCADEAYASSHDLIRMLNRDDTPPSSQTDAADDISKHAGVDEDGPMRSATTADNGTTGATHSACDTHDTRNVTYGQNSGDVAIASGMDPYGMSFTDGPDSRDGATSPSVTGYRWIGVIADALRRYDEQLSEAGFDGVGLPPTSASAPPAVSAAVLDETLALLGELYANVIKYADSSRPYIVAVNATADRIVVTCADTTAGGSDDAGNAVGTVDMDGTANTDGTDRIADMDDGTDHTADGAGAACTPAGVTRSHIHGSGTGLARRRARIERLGGTLAVAADGDAWHCEAILPYST